MSHMHPTKCSDAAAFLMSLTLLPDESSLFASLSARPAELRPIAQRRPIRRNRATAMPKRFESNVFDPPTTSLMKAALEAALLKNKASRTDEAKTRKLLVSAIIDQVNTGEWNREKIVSNSLAALPAARNISR
jgi:hypothetical protein